MFNKIKNLFKKSITIEDVLYQHNINKDIQNIILSYKKECEKIDNFLKTQEKYCIYICYDVYDFKLNNGVNILWNSIIRRKKLLLDLKQDSNYNIYKQIIKMETYKEKTGMDLCKNSMGGWTIKCNKELNKLIKYWYYEEIKEDILNYQMEGKVIAYDSLYFNINIANRNYFTFI